MEKFPVTKTIILSSREVVGKNTSLYGIKWWREMNLEMHDGLEEGGQLVHPMLKTETIIVLANQQKRTMLV
jgi:hypothetical protein